MRKPPVQTYQDIFKEKVGFEYFRNKLKLRNLEEEKSFFENFPKAKAKFAERKVGFKNIRSHSAKLLGAGILSGSFLLGTPSATKSLPEPHEIYNYADLNDALAGLKFKNDILRSSIEKILPEVVRPLSRNEEKILEYVVKDVTGMSVKASLEGEHLNTTFGVIGAEQHLKRFPGDNMSSHGDEKYYNSGMAPGLGAWGYFAKSEEAITESLIETEKWYAVVQTLYLPDWNTRQPYLKNWYKHRKIMILNVENGNAVVAAVADSGPAAWTGKHFGGSPEVMDYLGGIKYKKGRVLVFFVDDPENKVPLGPVEYGKIPSLANTLADVL
ncbi:MAG: hypothetical protein US95_C0032G0003 [Candidatus Woesebacteria bacterium GW2011_GWB1_38_5]|uniref:Uncharacterized protein n=3 Tax=Candidatus Woeseibacteriota TaxID=1752722 RepID=A0A0G0K5W9_9BACT|nr:MAG: hypothetical protein US67_C0005G0010 [Candidatus Woesebacteria bacterium GW2011_GWD1_38_10]KKQ55831.1 MAG: hypothetical protein US75_C0013G0007 [Candidatus Woesebacteria bacterium GW2011_GWC1_38_13]KKQ74187.1 MAG: hypothetical protein US95_C0032G0003 [Candidatus Woesebacteria bacterium GW2011_GWB1_38_5]